MWLVLKSRMLPENERLNILLNSMLEWKEPRLGFRESGSRSEITYIF